MKRYVYCAAVSVVLSASLLAGVAGAAESKTPEGWTLVMEDSFDKNLTMDPDGSLGAWSVHWGAAAISDGALRGGGTIGLKREIPGNQRVEFDCKSEEQNYIPVELCSSSASGLGQNGYWFGYRVGKKDSRVYVQGKKVFSFPVGETGKLYHVACQVEDYQATMWVDEKKVFETAYAPILSDPSKRYVIFNVPAGGMVDNFRVYTKAAGEKGKEGAKILEANERYDANFKPSLEFETPHIPYAKPYAQGPAKALILAWACTGRSAVELHQRMDLDFDYVAEGPNNLFWRGHPLSTGGGRAAELLQKHYDVIVMGAIPWGYYPRSVQAAILKQVENGAGLVFSHAKMPDAKDGVLGDLFKSAAPSPGYFPGDRAKVATRGKGRVAFVELKDPAPNEDFLKFFTGYAERGVEEFCRTILWAAGKDPKVSMEATALTGPLERSALAGQPLNVKLSNQGDAVEGKLVLTVRRDLDRQYPFLYGGMFYQFRPYASWEDVTRVEAPAKLQAGGSAEISLRPAALPAGKYGFDLCLRNAAGQVVAWRNLPVEIVNPAAIQELRIGKKEDALFKANEELASVCFTAEDTLHARVQAAGANGQQVRLTLFDRDGRVIGTEARPVTSGAASFALPLAAAYHRLLIARAELLDGENVLAELRAPVGLATRPERISAYRMRLYGCSLLRPELTAAGISYRIGYGIPLPQSLLQHAWHDMELGDFNWVLSYAKKITDGVREPSYNDPAFRKAQCEQLQKFLAPAAAFGVKVFLCDEWTYAWAPEHKLLWPEAANQDCAGPAKSDFRKYLENEYKDIAALNAEWGTRHDSFAAINPPVYDKDASKAPAESTWPQIIDHRTFVEKTVADFIKEAADAARTVSPFNQVGTSGHYVAGLWTGRDYYQWAKNGPHIVTYRNHLLWQSFIPGTVGMWLGYGEELKDPARESYRAWEGLFQGIEHAYWGREAPPFSPDFQLLKAPAPYFAAMREIRDTGIGDLLMGANQGNNIGILYHPKSSLMANILNWQYAKTDFMGAGDFLGSDVEGLWAEGTRHYVHAAQFLANDFGRYDRPALVWLPRTEILSDQEAAALKKYVEEGGILVADFHAGLRDAHGKRREQGALDDVFGLRRAGDYAAAVKAEGVVKFADGKEFKARLTGGMPVEAVSAKALASVTAGGKTAPACLVNRLGKGQAVYLNCVPADATMISRLREIVGLPAPFRVEGDTARINMIRPFQSGNQLYLGCIVAPVVQEKLPFADLADQAGGARSGPAVKTAPETSLALTLNQSLHVYDMRQRKYLGAMNKIPAKFQYPGNLTRIFACLPYKVEGVQVAGMEEKYSPGATVKFSATVAVPPSAKAGSHTLRVQVSDPKGQAKAVYAQSLAAQNGTAQGEFQLAQNDAAGTWQMIVTDVASGTESTVPFTVTAGK